MGVPILSQGLSGLPPRQVCAVRMLSVSSLRALVHSLPEIIRTNGTTGLLRPPLLLGGLGGVRASAFFGINRRIYAC
jgi:hypothetical protein